jgi:uncharacterized protein YjbI with pentapeptide repeats
MYSLAAVLFFCFHPVAHAADSREALHQRVLRGERILFDPADPEDARTVDAAWIKEAALKHVQVIIYDAVIRGRLDVRDVTFEQEVELGRCIVDEYADFSYTVFKHNLMASQTAFRQGATFESATFEYGAYFQQTEFDGGVAVFQDAHVLGVFDAHQAKFVSKIPSSAGFIRVRFDHSADFHNSSFGVDADFSGSQFRGKADFDGTRFERDAHFDRTHFHDAACFGCYYVPKTSFTVFKNKADFGSAQFDSDAIFAGTTFGSDAEYLRTRFGAAASFSGARFKSKADFWGSQISTDALFVGTEFEGQAMFESAHIFRHALFRSVSPLRAAVFRAGADFAWMEIDGIADFSGVLFTAKVNFTGTRIGENANFSRAEFRSGVDFIGAVIGGDAIFPETLFKQKALFNDVQIKGSALFRSEPISKHNSRPVKFDGETDFTGSHFGGNAEFDRAEFSNALKFEHAEIGGRTIFVEARFLLGSNPSFRGTTFRQESWFQGAQFTQGASFLGSQFYGEARFSGVEFDDTADFTAAQFAGLAFFNKGSDLFGASELPGTSFHGATFDHARFDGDADFTESTFANRASFRETTFRTVYFSPTGVVAGSQQFLGDIDLRGCTYDRIQTEWQSLLRYPDSESSRVKPFDRQPYVELEEVLRKAGSDEQAKAVYLERRRVERASMNRRARIWDYIYWLGANYGMDLWRECALAAALIMFGSFVYLRSGALVLAPDETATELKITWWDAIALATHHFLPFGLPVQPRWMPSTLNLWRFPVPFRKASTYANILQISGWILVPLGAATLAGILRRGAP